eukprot:CAMPEP_0182434280 /NCGR_PEP_ID=MMETSP1167-20130531/68872_1 /TAXON_ID=2988 /ORGANISM="Mallomonas Sp, Strain CCMP3275" /LENGTH=165 /DNA_ID=CAMNT_0024623975 /DNA_START=294 /DNA_END=792 /DNA_ORIENTATION=+
MSDKSDSDSNNSEDEEEESEEESEYETDDDNNENARLEKQANIESDIHLINDISLYMDKVKLRLLNQLMAIKPDVTDSSTNTDSSFTRSVSNQTSSPPDTPSPANEGMPPSTEAVSSNTPSIASTSTPDAEKESVTSRRLQPSPLNYELTHEEYNKLSNEDEINY